MECKEDGQKERLLLATRSKVERKRKVGDASGLRLALTTSVPYQFPSQAMHKNQVANHTADRSTTSMFPENIPFMNNMDEISYWVYTKRAPCLFNYDNLTQRPVEQAHCSNDKPISVSSEKPVPKKKRKIKLTDDSVSEKHENVFFGTPQHYNDKSGKKSGRSVSLGSHVDFNIKSPLAKRKNKKSSPNKVEKVVTSTPKNATLRRSTRKKQQNSLDNFDASAVNGNLDTTSNKREKDNASDKQVLDKKNAVNGQEQFEDDSDVSGFTANYIRSTKINSRTKRKSINKNRKTLLKNNKHSDKEKIVVCVNKSMNTGTSKVLNCSSDSSQNIINLVTIKSNELSSKVDKSTSLLKFVDTKGNQESVSHKKCNKRSRNNLNASFQSKSSSVSRYPKRLNNVSIPNSDEYNKHNKSSKALSHVKILKCHKNIDHEENKVDPMISRTRSGKKIGLDLEISGNTVLMLDSTNPASSSAAVNVAKVSRRSDKHNQSSKNRKRLSKKKVMKQNSESDSSKKSTNKTQDSLVKKLTRSSYTLRKSKGKSLKKVDNQRDSLQKSGFAACFSESDSDNEPLNRRKFFC